MNLALGIARPFSWGVLAFTLLLAIYFGALTLLTGWSATASQFSEFWYFIVALAAGFGLQVALFVHLRQIVMRARGTGSVLAASGTTSTAALVSCCAHYLESYYPLRAVTAQYFLEARTRGISPMRERWVIAGRSKRAPC